MNYRVKRESNDSLRQRFIDVTVSQAEFLGLTIPDKDLKWNEERGHYDFGELPWDEFMTILKGNGPCNKKRLQTKVKAQQEKPLGERSCSSFCGETTKRSDIR